MSSFNQTLASATLAASPDSLEQAGRMLEWHLKNDNSFPQLSDQLRTGPEGGSQASAPAASSSYHATPQYVTGTDVLTMIPQHTW